MDKLADDILPKTDGEPNPNDWITEPGSQQSLEDAVIYSINVLESLADSLGGCN